MEGCAARVSRKGAKAQRKERFVERKMGEKNMPGEEQEGVFVKLQPVPVSLGTHSFSFPPYSFLLLFFAPLRLCARILPRFELKLFAVEGYLVPMSGRRVACLHAAAKNLGQQKKRSRPRVGMFATEVRWEPEELILAGGGQPLASAILALVPMPVFRVSNETMTRAFRPGRRRRRQSCRRVPPP